MLSDFYCLNQAFLSRGSLDQDWPRRGRSEQLLRRMGGCLASNSRADWGAPNVLFFQQEWVIQLLWWAQCRKPSIWRWFIPLISGKILDDLLLGLPTYWVEWLVKVTEISCWNISRNHPKKLSITGSWLVVLGMRLTRRPWKGCLFWDVPFTIPWKGCKFERCRLRKWGFKTWI
jgi:hypothetical protein